MPKLMIKLGSTFSRLSFPWTSLLGFLFSPTFVTSLISYCFVFQDASALKTIDLLKVKAAPPGKKWVKNLYALVEKYFVIDPRPTVQVKALTVLRDIYLDHK